MPNWDRNHVALKGDPARLAAFKQTHIKTVENEFGHMTYLDLESVIPMPENIKAIVDWRYENWGTKCSAWLEVNPDSPDDILEFTFETANGLAVPVIRKLMLMWPDLTLVEYKGSYEADWHETEYDLLTEVVE